MAMINNLSSPSIRGETDLFRLPNTGNTNNYIMIGEQNKNCSLKL